MLLPGRRGRGDRKENGSGGGAGEEAGFGGGAGGGRAGGPTEEPAAGGGGHGGGPRGGREGRACGGDGGAGALPEDSVGERRGPGRGWAQFGARSGAEGDAGENGQQAEVRGIGPGIRPLRAELAFLAAGHGSRGVHGGR